MAKRKITREVWRAIPGFRGYEASSLGRIRSIDRVVMRESRWGGRKPRKYRGRVLKLAGSSPYLRVRTSYLLRIQYVHHLVALAFHGKVPKGKEVSHWDGNPRNNKPTNLIYETRSENNFRKATHLPQRTRCRICGLKCLIRWRDANGKTRFIRSPVLR